MKSDSEDIKERTESAVYVIEGENREYSLCYLRREQRLQSMLSNLEKVLRRWQAVLSRMCRHRRNDMMYVVRMDLLLYITYIAVK